MSVFSSTGSSRRGLRAVGRISLLLLGASSLSFSSPALAADARTRADGGRTKAEARKVAGTKAPRLSAAEIVRKHASARGGLQAWRAVQTLSMSGTMEAGTGDSIARSLRVARGAGAASRKARRDIAAGARQEEAPKQVQLPFTLAKARPNKSRLEIEFAGHTAVQVYDGEKGWKLRPYLNRSEVEPFTPQEAKAEAEAGDDDLADPLIDCAALGTKVELDGVEPVDGHAAYKLKLTARNGTVRHVWIDAKSFLDVKVEGAPRRMDGKNHSVWVYQRDFRSVQGLRVPFVLETAVDGYPQTHRIFVQKVAVNPKLDAAAFAKPKA